jgi:hypothetical protein
MIVGGGPFSASAQQAYNELDEGIAEWEILSRIDSELLESTSAP